MKIRRPFLIIGVWFILGLVYSSQSFFYSLSVGREYVWYLSLLHSYVFCIEWALLTEPVLRFIDRFRLDTGSFVRNLLIHFAAGSIIAIIQQTVYVVLVRFVENGFVLTQSFAQLLPSIVGFFEYGVLMYWSLVFISHGIRYYRSYQEEQKRASELRSQLVESQLQTLKMQLQPHFLFNTLNAISTLVKKEPAQAQKMISRLSDLLRLTLEQGNENEVTLEQELEFLNTYIAIEKVRFGDRLSVTMNIDESVMNACVPTFILQPLVENSVRHGIAKRSGEGWIEVKAERMNGRLLLEIIDGGFRSKRIKKEDDQSGIGLENTLRRLRQLYGGDFLFVFGENDVNGATVKIGIPLKSK